MSAVLEAVELALNTGDDPDDALREVVGTLVARGVCAWAGILFSEDGELVLGPSAGEPAPEARLQLPVLFQTERVAELVADSCTDPALLEQVAGVLGPYCIVGWDTDGVPWDAVS